jgi:hypothetical protein
MRVISRRNVVKGFWVVFQWQLKTNASSEEVFQFETRSEMKAFLEGVEACYGKKDFAITASSEDEVY